MQSARPPRARRSYTSAGAGPGAAAGARIGGKCLGSRRSKARAGAGAAASAAPSSAARSDSATAPRSVLAPAAPAPERPRGTLSGAERHGARGRRTRQNLCITRKRHFRAEDLYDFCHKSTDADRYGRESRVPSIWNYCTTVTDIDGYERAIESFSRVRRPTYKN